jgi:mono/diheme cytochrome c family protein
VRRLFAVMIGMLLVLAAATVAFAVVAWGEQPSKRPDDLVRGKELYERHCIQCHGALDDGAGPAATALVKPPPNLQEAITSDNFDEMVQVVLDGKGAMPSFVNSFDKYDARRAVRHMKTLGRDGGDLKAPEDETPETPNDDAPADGPE